MKATHILKLLSITVLLAAGFIACKKEVEIYLPEQTDLTSKSYLRVYINVWYWCGGKSQIGKPQS